MFDEHRRPWGRLFYLLAFVVVGLTASWAQTRPQPGRPVLHSDLHLDAAGRGTELLPAAVRQLDAAQIFPVHDRVAPQVSI